MEVEKKEKEVLLGRLLVAMVTNKIYSWTFCSGRWSRIGPGGSS